MQSVRVSQSAKAKGSVQESKLRVALVEVEVVRVVSVYLGVVFCFFGTAL